MNLEEAEARNDCPGEGQRQSNRPNEGCRQGLVVRQSPAGEDVSTEEEEYLLLQAVARQRLLKTYKPLSVLQCSDL
jgi:hypothetical protein